MGHSLWLTDGTTTIQLNDGSAGIVEEYQPAVVELAPALDWREVNAQRVVDAFPLIVIAASKTALQTAVRAIEKMISTGYERQLSASGPRVFIHLQVDGEASSWRSEVVGGRLELLPEGMQAWGNVKALCRLFLQRRPYWETASEVEVPLSVNDGTAVTGGVTIYNHNDGGTGHDNWVAIAAAALDGVLPAPARVKLINNNGAAKTYYRAYLALNRLNASTFAHTLEGESRETGYGTVVAHASYSNGEANTRTFTDSGVVRWALGSSLMIAAAGRSFRVLGRLPAYAAGSGYVYARVQMWDASGTVYYPYESDEVLLPTSAGVLVDLGKVTLPPGGSAGSWAGGMLELQLRGAGSSSVTIDFLQLTPLDGFRRLESRGLAYDNGDSLVDDGIDEAVYGEDAGTALRHPLVIGSGDQLMLWPGVAQRMMVLHDLSSGGAPIDLTFSLRVWWRPRRLTV